MKAPKVRLKTVSKIYNGATPKSDNLDYWDGDIAWATPVDLSRLKDKFLETTNRTITEAGYVSCNTKLVEPGNIVISNRAPIGLVAINKVPVCTNQGCKIIEIDKSKINATYLYYYLCSITDVLNNQGYGTTFLEISADALKNIEIPLPTLEEQEKIAKNLDKNIDKIHAAKGRISDSVGLLEEYKTSLITNAVTGEVKL